MRIRYIGHSAFYIEVAGKYLLFDPWINNNPKAAFTLDNVLEWPIDYIFVSHSHRDHGLDEAIEISRKKGVPVVGIFELVNYVKQNGGNGIPANIGGEVPLKEDLSVILTPAFHSSDLGAPVGFIIKTKDVVFYHAGDTSYFAEMESFSDLYNVQLAFLPIGGVYTMGVEEAAYAALKIKPKIVVPMHYNTFPAIQANPESLKAKLEDKIRVDIMKPGDNLTLF